MIFTRPAGSSKNNLPADSEVSLSSERDAYKQKFSVATHPVLPMILCSDGYLLTVMKLEESYNLTSLVMSLVKASKARLAQYNEMKGHLEASTKEKKAKQSLSSISLHDDCPKVFSDISNLSDLTQTGLHSTSKYSVQFAGINSINETSFQSGDDPLNHVFSQATTAFCLLLNSEMLLPYHGMFPYKRTIDSAKMSTICSDVVKAGDIVIATLLGIDGPLDSCLKSSFSMSYLSSVVLKIFDLMSLDVNSSHYGLFSKLITAFLQLYFTELHRGIDHWSAVLKYNYNDKLKFIDNYSYKISTAANLLHYVIEQFNSVYHMSSSLSDDEIFSFTSISFLVPSFQFLIKDVYFFINLLKNLYAQNQPKVLNHVRECIRTSLEVLKFAKDWLKCLTGTKPPNKRLIPGNYM